MSGADIIEQGIWQFIWHAAIGVGIALIVLDAGRAFFNWLDRPKPRRLSKQEKEEDLVRYYKELGVYYQGMDLKS